MDNLVVIKEENIIDNLSDQDESPPPSSPSQMISYEQEANQYQQKEPIANEDAVQ